MLRLEISFNNLNFSLVPILEPHTFGSAQATNENKMLLSYLLIGGLFIFIPNLRMCYGTGMCISYCTYIISMLVIFCALKCVY